MTEQRKLRICIDLDGTICDIRKDGETYADVRAKPGAAEKIRAAQGGGAHGDYQYRAQYGLDRAQRRQGAENVGKMTFEWLEKNGIEYDEIFFGKPNADITIDDRAVRFADNWAEISEDMLMREAKAK